MVMCEPIPDPHREENTEKHFPQRVCEVWSGRCGQGGVVTKGLVGHQGRTALGAGTAPEPSGGLSAGESRVARSWFTRSPPHTL